MSHDILFPLDRISQNRPTVPRSNIVKCFVQIMIFCFSTKKGSQTNANADYLCKRSLSLKVTGTDQFKVFDISWAFLFQ